MRLMSVSGVEKPKQRTTAARCAEGAPRHRSEVHSDDAHGEEAWRREPLSPLQGDGSEPTGRQEWVRGSTLDTMSCDAQDPSMKSYIVVGALSLVVLITFPVRAQEPVLGVADPEALFKSPDSKLNANKQVVYGIFRDLLEANHWELADKYLTERYIQHNPNAASGRAGVVTFFTQVMKVQPKPIEKKLKSQIVSVTAEGDLVTVAWPREYKDPKNPSKTYTTTWFDMWRIKDGKADEHWDSAMKSP
jgi:predicted SnoaL-like aldol condensation-catalyzing enzyme